MRKMMFNFKRTLRTILMVTSVGIFWLPSLSFAKINSKADGIAVIVNNNVILDSDIANLTNRITKQTDKKNLPAPNILRKQIIDQLINETLIIQQANKANISISDPELEQAIEGIAAQNKLTMQEFKNYLNSTGLDFNLYKEQIRRDMLMDQIRLAELRDRITVSDYEIKTVTKNIDQQPTQNFAVDLSHILIAVPEKASSADIEEAQRKVNIILESLSKGESFSKLAMTYSNDELALSGGSMGWSDVHTLPSLFEQHAAQAKKGEILGPIRSSAGFHILKVNDTKSYDAPKMDTEEVDARHILLTTNVILDDEHAKAKLEQLRSNILSGKMTFAQAANLYSEDPGTINKGGDLGWSDPNIFDSSFRNALIKLKPDEISQPIKTKFGWHLIQMIGSRTVDATEVNRKDQAYRVIFNRKFNEESQVWAQALRGDAYIKIFDENANE